MRKNLIVALVFFGLVAAPASATEIRVPADQPTIQAGIDVAVDGDVVVVAPGTYKEYNVNFRGKSITVTSTDPADTAVVAATVVDAQSRGSVFVLKSEEDSLSVLQGFTITGGYAVNGGGVFINYSTPRILDCVFEANYGQVGGGVFSTMFANPSIERCVIRNNTAHSVGGVYAGGSGNVRHCTVIDNYASWSVGGVEFGDHVPATMENCVVARNSSWVDGGEKAGVLSWADLTLTNCTIADNIGVGILQQASGKLVVLNSIVVGSEAAVVNEGWQPTEVSYSMIEGGWSGVGNIDADPLFTSYRGYEYVLGPGSPAIDAGDPAVADGISDWHPRWPARYPNGPRSDMGAYGGPDNGGWVR